MTDRGMDPPILSDDDRAALDAMRTALLDALDDLWSNIAPREVRQLQPETLDLCRFVHEVREHGAHWTDWRHQR